MKFIFSVTFFFSQFVIAQPILLSPAPPSGGVQPLRLPPGVKTASPPVISINPGGVNIMKPIVLSSQEREQLQFQTRAAFPEDVVVEATEREDPPTLVACDKLWIRILEKPTARVYTFEVPLGKPFPFDRLEIHAKNCYKTDPDHAPEMLAFLEIFEKLVDTGERVQIFRNWMYATAPAVSALDHPLYDIWILPSEESSSK